MLHYQQMNTHFFTDCFFAPRVASIHGFTCMLLFDSDKEFVKVYGLTSPAQFLNALNLFCKEVGAPSAVIFDPHQAQKREGVHQFCHTIGSKLCVHEESAQHVNGAELYIGC